MNRQQMINHLLERGIFGADFLNSLSDTLLREHYDYDIRLLERIGVATKNPQFLSERYMKMAGVDSEILFESRGSRSPKKNQNK